MSNLRNTRSYSRNLLQLLVGLSLCTLLMVGCSSSNNPTDPGDGKTDPPPVQIKKPQKITISSIQVTRTQDKDWDPSELIVAWKKADLFVRLGRSGGEADYSSNTINDVDYNGTYTFTKRGGITGNELPLEYLYVDDLRIELWDFDLIGSDLMGVVSFNPSQLYNNDEATTFSKRLSGSNSSQIVVKGTFRY